MDFFGEESRIGKTLGTDFASGKLTLPLLALLERLPPAERTALTGEITGGHPPQPALRLRQMRDLGVFRVEIAGARAALRDWPGHAPTPLLLSLCDLLGAQVTALQPSA